MDNSNSPGARILEKWAILAMRHKVTLLSDEYLGSVALYKWKCSSGHEWMSSVK
jgi:hypothetical protein